MLPRQVLAKDTSNGPDSAPNFSSQDQIKNRFLEDANLKNTMNHNIQNKTTVLNTNVKFTRKPLISIKNLNYLNLFITLKINVKPMNLQCHVDLL